MARNFYPYPFTIAIPEETLTDLRDRLVKTRWAPDFANPN